MQDKAISLNAVIDALDQSINIFEAEDRIRDLPSVTPCDDAISRQAAIKAIYEDWDGIQFVDDNGFGVASDCESVLLGLPTVTPQPKTGHWIFKHFDEDTGISNSYWCSECDTPLSSVYKNYCPNCGAKMVEPQKSEG